MKEKCVRASERACVRAWLCLCLCVCVCVRIRDHETIRIRSLRLTFEELHRLEDVDDCVSLNLTLLAEVDLTCFTR